MFEKYGIKKFLYTNGKLNFAETRVSNALTYSIRIANFSNSKTFQISEGI